jgi:hypothetical protein
MEEGANRNVVDIACKILELTPDSEKDFINDMRSVLMGFAYSAPELLYHKDTWSKLEIVINKHIKNTNCSWKENVIELYTGRKQMKSIVVG